MSTLLPIVLTVFNLLSMYYVDNACAKKTKFPWPRTIMFSLYTMLLFGTLFFGTDLASVVRNQLYYRMPFTLLWMLLVLFYFMIPVLSSMAAIRHIHDKQCTNRFGKHVALFVAYFSMVYVLLNIRATRNLRIVDRLSNCAISTYY